MKKIISIMLLLALTVSLFAGCGASTEPASTTAPTTAPASTESALERAKQSVVGYFQGAESKTSTDYKILGAVVVDGVTFPLKWTCDNANVKIVPQDDGMVLIDIPELAAEEVTYKLTATITDAEGNTAEYSITRKIPADAGAGKTYEELVKKAYELEVGAEMEGTATLVGVVKSIRIPYDSGYKNITVIIQVGNLAEMPIDCYRLKGEGIDKLAPGDTVTVMGTLKNHEGSIQFNAGCEATLIVAGPKVTCPATTAEVLAAAKALEAGWALPYKSSMTGVVNEITSAYDAKYMNLSCTITVEGETVICYRMVGELGATLKAGDTITVTGYLMNYKGDLEYGQGCTLDNVVPGTGTVDPEPTPTPDPEPGNLAVVDAPTAGVAYKFGMVQQNAGKTVYLKGGMDGYYMATSENTAEAIDVYLEETTGGYYLYTMDGETKLYINMVVSGTHVNGAYEAAAATVYTYDADAKTLKADVNEKPYWFGTRNDKTYLTVGPCAVEYNGFYCQFYL